MRSPVGGTGVGSPSVLKAFAAGQMFGVVHGSGRPWLLCLPGWGRSHDDFEAVAKGLDVIALDLPGFGASPSPTEPCGAAGYAQIVAQVLQEMSSPLVVLGHSFGGRVAVHLACSRPEQVGGLVLTAVPLLPRPGARRRRPAAAYRLGRALHRRGLLGERRMEALRRRYGSADYRAASGVMRQVHVRVVNESYEEELRSISCPVELVWGDDDTETPLAVAEAARGLLTTVNLTVVPGAGHMTPVTAPEELRAAVERCR
jgi:pimeloyl-ACP methyl ester carboxylesterase